VGGIEVRTGWALTTVAQLDELREEYSAVFLGMGLSRPKSSACRAKTWPAWKTRWTSSPGWGGVVWKTLGEAGPPVVNVNGPRYGALLAPDRRLLGFNNIELITDRDLEINLAEITQVKRDWPDRAMVVSLMVPCNEPAWKAILARIADTGADGIELNFGCPHGMSERGMGAAVGQVPEYIQMVTEWCKHYSRLPVIVKLTPNITDVRLPARAAKRGGADAVSLINTIMGVDPYSLTMLPSTGGKGSHGGYCGPAVKPIALNMVAEIARKPPACRSRA
jgi:dihydropyrimidine dehydrogenase (NAD+) subunit PreA